MRVFEIILPRRDNSGVALHQAHMHYQEALLDCFGGFTQYDVQGIWHDDGGKRYTDYSVAYRVALDDEPELVAMAEPLFPDQLAFYVAEIGTAEIIKR